MSFRWISQMWCILPRYIIVSQTIVYCGSASCLAEAFLRDYSRKIKAFRKNCNGGSSIKQSDNLNFFLYCCIYFFTCHFYLARGISTIFLLCASMFFCRCSQILWQRATLLLLYKWDTIKMDASGDVPLMCDFAYVIRCVRRSTTFYQLCGIENALSFHCHGIIVIKTYAFHTIITTFPRVI